MLLYEDLSFIEYASLFILFCFSFIHLGHVVTIGKITDIYKFILGLIGFVLWGIFTFNNCNLPYSVVMIMFAVFLYTFCFYINYLRRERDNALFTALMDYWERKKQRED